jgi:hypothetical protein
MKHALSDEDVTFSKKPVKRVIAEGQLFCFGMVRYNTLLLDLPLAVDEVASRSSSKISLPARGALCIL